MKFKTLRDLQMIMNLQMFTERTTVLADLIDPEVMAEMISAKVDKKIKVSKYAKLDTTLQGQPGSTITVPRYGYIGDAVDVAEGEEIPIRSLGTDTAQYTIKKAGIGGELTDEAVLSGYGNPVGQLNNQIALSIISKVDADSMEEFLKAPTTYSPNTTLCYNAVVNGIDKFEEEENSEKVIFVHPNQVTQLRLDSNFIDKTKYSGNVMVDGEIGMIGNARIVPSKRVQKDASGKYYMNPIVKLNNDAESEDDLPALTIYVKRETNVETDRKARARKTEVTGDRMYVAALTNSTKVVILKCLANTDGSPVVTNNSTGTLLYHNDSDLVVETAGTDASVKANGTEYDINISGVAPLIKDATKNGLGFDASITNTATTLIKVDYTGVFDATKVKFNGVACEAGDIATIGGDKYLIIVSGLKKVNKAITATSNQFTLAYDSGAAKTFNFTYTGLTLAKA